MDYHLHIKKTYNNNKLDKVVLRAEKADKELADEREQLF